MTPGRRRPQLRPPRSRDLSGFPTWRLTRRTPLYRAHHHANGPWWFSCDGSGRFDLPDPKGTCYLASTEEAAARERWGEDLMVAGAVPHAVAEQTTVSRLAVRAACNIGDLRHARAAQYGLNAEVHTTSHYRVTQAWAQALARTLSGLKYSPRFSTSSQAWALALFGDKGQPAGWASDPAPEDGLEVAYRVGINIAAPPSVAALRAAIATPPARTP